MGRTKTTEPTHSQELAIRAAELRPKDWRVLEDRVEEIALVHKRTGATRRVKKTGGKNNVGN